SQRFCPDCGTAYVKNGSHQLTFRTLFGTMKLASQRFFTCPCQKARISVLGHKDKMQQQVYEVLKSQGMQMNQQVIFLSDGGDDVRNLQLYLNPYAEYLLD